MRPTVKEPSPATPAVQVPEARRPYVDEAALRRWLTTGNFEIPLAERPPERAQRPRR